MSRFKSSSTPIGKHVNYSRDHRFTITATYSMAKSFIMASNVVGIVRCRKSSFLTRIAPDWMISRCTEICVERCGGTYRGLGR